MDRCPRDSPYKVDLRRSLFSLEKEREENGGSYILKLNFEKYWLGIVLPSVTDVILL